MPILYALIVGGAVGVLADMFTARRVVDMPEVTVKILLGIAGSMIGGFVGRTFGWTGAAVSGPGILLNLGGAGIMLAIYYILVHRKR